MNRTRKKDSTSNELFQPQPQRNLTSPHHRTHWTIRTFTPTKTNSVMAQCLTYQNDTQQIANTSLWRLLPTSTPSTTMQTGIP
ncbi:hypothetical protein XfasM23_0303 [Xylella fastidiosa M23]|uniref:Uncharacterized protein n=1 Tax=Xylella fastidiosa (strain M23) TaxID=405441 RepID=B2I7M4_XYLF2|nr:hypothetical protein XfasM23_0303 [Xylella fastidiosa M23]